VEQTAQGVESVFEKVTRERRRPPRNTPTPAGTPAVAG
jgi:hypothetical protein